MNDEDYERAMDIAWAQASADDRMVERGCPLADRIEEDEHVGRRPS